MKVKDVENVIYQHLLGKCGEPIIKRVETDLRAKYITYILDREIYPSEGDKVHPGIHIQIIPAFFTVSFSTYIYRVVCENGIIYREYPVGMQTRQEIDLEKVIRALDNAIDTGLDPEIKKVVQAADGMHKSVITSELSMLLHDIGYIDPEGVPKRKAELDKCITAWDAINVITADAKYLIPSIRYDLEAKAGSVLGIVYDIAEAREELVRLTL